MVIGRTPEETYWEFFRADRTKDAKAWAAVLSYPHVRVAAPGRIEYFRTAAEFVASTDWIQREATGWVRTEGVEPRVFQSTRDKVHLAGGWVRYNAENEPILTNRVVYALTRGKKGWGVKVRFACGASAEWEDIADEETLDVVKRFLQVVKAGDAGAYVRLVRYPFFVIGADTVHRFESGLSLTRSIPNLDLSPVAIEDISLIQNGQQGSTVAVSFRTYDNHVRHAVILAARKKEGYRLAAISLI